MDGIQSLSPKSRKVHCKLRAPRQPARWLRKAIARVDWVVATARSLREKEHKHLATSIAQGGFNEVSLVAVPLNTRNDIAVRIGVSSKDTQA